MRDTVGRRKSEAELVAEMRPCCDQCGDDMNPVFRAQVGDFDLMGRASIGERICAPCLPRAGFTGWTNAAGGWADPFGRDEPLPEEGDKPATWQQIGAALEGRYLEAA
jgi:hypothetical protein